MEEYACTPRAAGLLFRTDTRKPEPHPEGLIDSMIYQVRKYEY